MRASLSPSRPYRIYLRYLAMMLVLCGLVSRPSPVWAQSRAAGWTKAPRLLAPTQEAYPKFEQIRVSRGNYRRVLWGHGLTVAGIAGVLAGAVGMVLLGQSSERYEALNGSVLPLTPAQASEFKRVKRRRNSGIALLSGGLVLGVGGLVAGPLLVRSGRRRHRAGIARIFGLFSPQVMPGR